MCDKEGNGVIFFGHACVFVCVKEREREGEKIMCGGFDKHRGGLCMHLCVHVCVFVCTGCQSHPACSQRVEDDRRVHSRRRACYADCNFRPRIFFFFFWAGENKAKEEKMINKRCNLLQGTGSHWRMRA